MLLSQAGYGQWHGYHQWHQAGCHQQHQAGYRQWHQLLGLEKLGLLCVRYRNSVKTSLSPLPHPQVPPTRVVRVLLVNFSGARLSNRVGSRPRGLRAVPPRS